MVYDTLLPTKKSKTKLAKPKKSKPKKAGKPLPSAEKKFKTQGPLSL